MSELSGLRRVMAAVVVVIESPIKKCVIFYALPRSGSTPIAKILARGLQSHGYKYLEESLHPDFIGDSYDGRDYSSDLRSWRSKGDPLLTEDEQKDISKAKLKNLLESVQVHDRKYCLKVFPFFERSMGGEGYAKLIGESKIVFIYRKKLFENLLSYLVSLTSRSYYHPEGIKIRTGSIQASERLFSEFMIDVLTIWRRMKANPQAPVLNFEDYLRDGAPSVLRKAGLNENADLSQLNLPPKQNPDDKLQLFSNPDQILTWYKRSSLNTVWPVH